MGKLKTKFYSNGNTINLDEVNVKTCARKRKKKRNENADLQNQFFLECNRKLTMSDILFLWSIKWFQSQPPKLTPTLLVVYFEEIHFYFLKLSFRNQKLLVFDPY